jgi:hypothetical protein
MNKGKVVIALLGVLAGLIMAAMKISAGILFGAQLICLLLILSELVRRVTEK